MYARNNFYGKKFACYAMNHYLCLNYSAMACNVLSSKGGSGSRIADLTKVSGRRESARFGIKRRWVLLHSNILMPGVQQHRA